MGQPLRIILLLAAAGAGAVVRAVISDRRTTGGDTATERGDKTGGGWWKRQLWTTAKYFAVFGLLMMIGGFLFAASGIMPIKASSGHWAITRWFLNFSSERSIATHTLGMKAPPLDAARLVLKGAGAYETNCRACHGSPSLMAPRVAQGMTPRPPYLSPVLPTWKDEQLFYVVKHGIKFTGMPAWPAQQRDDEVWAVVAFLRKLPQLDAQGYRQLVSGEAPAARHEAAPMEGMAGPETVPAAITASCARCHGMDGLGRGAGAFPKLAGQRPEYLYQSLRAYARLERHSGLMAPVIAGLSDDELRDLARYYAALPNAAPQILAGEDREAVERGAEIARRGIPQQRVPACAVCHGGGGGDWGGETPRNPIFPVLAGQYADYLYLQLELFKNERRGGTSYAHLMHPVAARLTPAQMHDVTLYYSSLAPAHKKSGGATP